MSERLHGLFEDMSSEDYHNYPGVYSSSQMKDLLEDPEIFYRKYITKEQEKISIPAFDVGTAFHTAILEPEKIESEVAVFTGIRRGKEWEAFKEIHAGKAIITASENETAEGLIKAVRNSPIAMNRIDRCQKELSGFTDLFVYQGEVFNEHGDILGVGGWERSNITVNKKKAICLPMKVRADAICDDFILDLKSTTGNAKSEKNIKNKVSDYCYDLSAAMYLDLFSVVKGRVISEFVWVFASKDLFNCKSWKASAENIAIGRVKFRKAVLTLADCIESNWQFEDSLGILEPSAWELPLLKRRAEDML